MKFILTLILLFHLTVNYSQSKNCLNFDGIDDYIDLNSISQQFAQLNEFTIEFWFKIDLNLNMNEPRVNFFAVNPRAPEENKFSIVLGSDESTQNGLISIFQANTIEKYLTSTEIVGDNNCHHFAFSKKNNQGKAYIDGKTFGSYYFPTIFEADDRISIGQEWDNTTTSGFMNGNMSDFIIWNRELSYQQMTFFKKNYESHTDKILCYLSLNQGVANSVNNLITNALDYSPNNLNGILMNFDLNGNNSNWVTSVFAPEINLIDESYLCEGAEVTITPSITGQFVWFDGTNETSKSFTNEGTFWIQSTNGDCSLMDSVKIIEIKKIDITPVYDTFCEQNGMMLNGFQNNVNEYSWNNGSNHSIQPIHTAGIYELNLKNECENVSKSYYLSSKSCFCDLYIPNAFSPNGDEFNNQFKAVSECKLFDFHIIIFNKLGEIIFESYDQQIGWDGTYQSFICPNDIYTYTISYQSIYDDSLIFKNGFVVLIK